MKFWFCWNFKTLKLRMSESFFAYLCEMMWTCETFDRCKTEWVFLNYTKLWIFWYFDSLKKFATRKCILRNFFQTLWNWDTFNRWIRKCIFSNYLKFWIWKNFNSLKFLTWIKCLFTNFSKMWRNKYRLNLRIIKRFVAKL